MSSVEKEQPTVKTLIIGKEESTNSGKLEDFHVSEKEPEFVIHLGKPDSFKAVNEILQKQKNGCQQTMNISEKAGSESLLANKLSVKKKVKIGQQEYMVENFIDDRLTVGGQLTVQRIQILPDSANSQKPAEALYPSELWSVFGDSKPKINKDSFAVSVLREKASVEDSKSKIPGAN